MVTAWGAQLDVICDNIVHVCVFANGADFLGKVSGLVFARLLDPLVDQVVEIAPAGLIQFAGAPPTASNTDTDIGADLSKFAHRVRTAFLN